MADKIAINDNGEALRFDGKAWVPAPVAANDKGERVVFDGEAWKPMGGAPKSTGAKLLDTAGDVAKGVNTGINWLGTQFTKGLTGLAGAPRAAADTSQAVSEWAGDKLGMPGVGQAVGQVARLGVPGFGMTPSSEELNKSIFGSLGVPQTNAADNPAFTVTPPMLEGRKINFGKMLDAGAEAIPGMAMLPMKAAGALSPMARMAATTIPGFAGGAGSEAAGQMTANTPYELPARLAGGVVGMLAGNKAVTPLPANLTPQEARTVALAKDMGIPMTVGQETGRGRGIESALARFPTSAGQFAEMADQQAVGANKAGLKQMEAPASLERVDPESMKAAWNKASNDFNVAKQTGGPVTLKPDFFNDAGAAVGKYTENTASSATVPSVVKRFEDFFDPKLMKPGNTHPELTGEQYQEFRKGINTAVENTTDTGARKALQGIRTALDDAMEASLPADKAEAWKEARKNWANLKILTKAAAGGTADSRSAGNLAPGALTAAVRQAQGPDRFARTEGGMNDVARVAGYLADSRPNSGTPQTLAMQSMLTGGPVAAGYAMGGPAGAAMAGGAMMAPNVLARAMTGSRGAGWLRDYLANQTMPNARPELYGPRRLPFSMVPGGMTALPRVGNSQ